MVTTPSEYTNDHAKHCSHHTTVACVAAQYREGGAALGAALGTGAALGLGAGLVMAASLGLGGGSVLALGFAFVGKGSRWLCGQVRDPFLLFGRGRHGRLGLVLAARRPASWPSRRLRLLHRVFNGKYFLNDLRGIRRDPKTARTTTTPLSRTQQDRAHNHKG